MSIGPQRREFQVDILLSERNGHITADSPDQSSIRKDSGDTSQNHDYYNSHVKKCDTF